MRLWLSTLLSLWLFYHANRLPDIAETIRASTGSTLSEKGADTFSCCRPIMNVAFCGIPVLHREPGERRVSGGFLTFAGNTWDICSDDRSRHNPDVQVFWFHVVVVLETNVPEPDSIRIFLNNILNRWLQANNLTVSGFSFIVCVHLPSGRTVQQSV